MRTAEARLSLATVSAREGDLEGAVAFAISAYEFDTKPMSDLLSPKLRLIGLALGPWPAVCLPGLGGFWLLQGERDGQADEVERLALVAGGLGQHWHGGAGAGEADLVAGQGGQVAEQAAEAAVGAAGLVVLAGGLGLGGCGAGGGGDRVGGCGRVFVGEGQRCPGAAQVPGQVAGEHADQ